MISSRKSNGHFRLITFKAKYFIFILKLTPWSTHFSGNCHSLHSISQIKYLGIFQFSGIRSRTRSVTFTFKLHTNPMSSHHSQCYHLFFDYTAEPLTWLTVYILALPILILSPRYTLKMRMRSQYSPDQNFKWFSSLLEKKSKISTQHISAYKS